MEEGGEDASRILNSLTEVMENSIIPNSSVTKGNISVMLLIRTKAGPPLVQQRVQKTKLQLKIYFVSIA